jgi:3-oxoadipate enol-lactonase
VLAYRLDGPDDAPVVLLASSLGTTAAMWEPQAEALSAFRVLRYDHPGHGGSPLAEASVTAFAAPVLAVLDELGVDSVSACGLSLGGAVAMRLALDAPGRIDRLVLASTAARFPNAETYAERARTVRENGLEPIADATMGRWFTERFRDAEPGTVRRYRDMLVSTPVEGYARGCEVVSAFDVRGELARIAAPTLVVAGADDPATTPSVGAELAAAIPGAELVVLADDAHLANVGQPEAFSRALVDHLAG